MSVATMADLQADYQASLQVSLYVSVSINVSLMSQSFDSPFLNQLSESAFLVSFSIQPFESSWQSSQSSSQPYKLVF